MKKIQLLLSSLCLLFVAMFISCSDEHSDQEQAVPLSISGADVLTRSKGNFEKGDQIGLFVYDENGNKYNDCDCSWNNMASLDDQWVMSKNVYLSNQTVTIRAYYPFNPDVNSSVIPIETATQTDYLYSREVTANIDNPSISLQMRHALSLLKLVVKKDNYQGEGNISGVLLQGINLAGSLDLATGDITVTRTGNENYSGQLKLEESLTIGIMTIPQNVTSSAVVVIIDGERYGFKLPESEWQQGKENTYTLGIDISSRKLFQVGASIIDEWGAGGSYDGNLTPGIDIGTEI